MNGVLILAHDSRATETKQTVETVIGRIKEKLPNIIIELSYVGMGGKSVKSGLEKLAQNGVTDIKIVPYFLFEGMHIREGIPKEITEFLLENAEIKVIMGKTLGDDERISEILIDRILE